MRIAALAIVALVALPACQPGRHSDRQIQLCLHDADGVDLFESILRGEAERFGLQFFDGSEVLEEQLQGMGSANRYPYPIKDFHAHDADKSVEISASNIGLGRYQTTLGYDLRSEKQRAFAESLEEQLSRHFTIELPREGQGALPLMDCPA